nr:septum site-determining protein MinC [Virgibacillus sp. LDC-1]
MHEKKQLITIKGTREGLTFVIDDSCSFEEAYIELGEKMSISLNQKEEPIVPVVVRLGNRYIHSEQKEKIKNLIEAQNRFSVQSFESDVISKQDALLWQENSTIKVENCIVRSGQVLEVTGDLLLIGDVNPGGKIMATGNIYILGSLQGIGHAGTLGDRNAIIAASYMKPSQLRIADYISRAPDYESEGVFMECGFIDEKQDKIIIDRLSVLSHRLKTLSGFERRIKNG